MKWLILAFLFLMSVPVHAQVGNGEGKKMKWLILRGLVREQRHWGDFRPIFENELQKLDPQAEVYALDLPGFGTEVERLSPFNIPEIVQDLRERWLKFQGSGEWNLLAISLGGMVALKWCELFPQDFKKLVLINSSLAGLSPFYKRLKPANYTPILSLLLKNEIAEREKKVLNLTTSLTGDALEEYAKRYASFALPIRKRDAIAQIIAAARFKTPTPASISLPMLVLVAMKDTLVDPSCSEMISGHYGAELQRHPSSNHDLSIDDPNWIANQVSNWMQKP